MKKKYLILLFILGTIYSSTAQNYTKKQVDSLLIEVQRLGDSIPDKAILKSLECYSYALKINYKKGMALSALLAGKNFFDTSQYDKGLYYTIKAQKALEEVDDYKLLSEAFRLKGICYTALGLSREAGIELKKGLAAANEIRVTDDALRQKGLIYTDMAVDFDRNGKPIDSVVKYFTLSYRQFDKIKEGKTRAVTLSLASANVGACFLALKQYDSARIYLEKAIWLADEIQYNSAKLYALIDFGNMELERKNDEAAVAYYLQSLTLAKKLKKTELLRDVYLNLSKAYGRLGADKEEERYSDNYIRLNDSILKTQKRAVEVPVKEILQTRYSKFEKVRTIATVVVIIIVLLALFLFYLTVRFHRKIKRESKVITEKNERLLAKEELLQKEVILNQVNLEKIAQLAKENDSEFLNNFVVIYADFYDKLVKEVPNLTAAEFKICALLKLGFSIKEIALYTDVTVRSVESRIFRVRKKAAIPSDKDISLWIAEF